MSAGGPQLSALHGHWIEKASEFILPSAESQTFPWENLGQGHTDPQDRAASHSKVTPPARAVLCIACLAASIKPCSEQLWLERDERAGTEHLHVGDVILIPYL